MASVKRLNRLPNFDDTYDGGKMRELVRQLEQLLGSARDVVADAGGTASNDPEIRGVSTASTSIPGTNTFTTLPLVTTAFNKGTTFGLSGGNLTNLTSSPIFVLLTGYAFFAAVPLTTTGNQGSYGTVRRVRAVASQVNTGGALAYPLESSNAAGTQTMPPATGGNAFNADYVDFAFLIWLQGNGTVSVQAAASRLDFVGNPVNINAQVVLAAAKVGSGGSGLTAAQLAQLAKAHDQNTDTALAQGTPSQVTASEIRTYLDEPVLTAFATTNVAMAAGQIGRLSNDIVFPVVRGDSQAINDQLVVCTQTVSAGTRVKVITKGPVNVGSVNFPSPGRVFLSDTGLPTAVAPTSGNFVQLGNTKGSGGPAYFFDPSLRYFGA